MTTDQDDARGRDSVRSALRAFSIVSLFSSQRPQLTMKEISEGAELPSSTTARLIQTLAGEGYLRKCDNGAYAPGPRLIEMAASISGAASLTEIVRPHLETLRAETGETVCFAIKASETEAVYLDQCDSPQSVRHVRWVGERVPLANTAIGAALTGGCAPGEAKIALKTYEKDVSAVAAPIRNGSGKIVGAINVTGPSYRLTEAKLQQMGEALLREISKIEGSSDQRSNSWAI
ncbi:IclR family transcriptional regulator [Mesorhizobium sp. 1B3]|uniref:IclR family transcriptional regulator n=1 Tax=Mesorhizobium sp. 1B3 TaxID=3243599 RepID=UPI003D98826A